MIYYCCDESRRHDVRRHHTLNGIDFLEVLDNDAPAASPRQRTLLVRLLKAATSLTRDNVKIEGGERVQGVRVEWAFPAPSIPAPLVSPVEQSFFASLPAAKDVLVVRTDSDGDFSTYRLSLIKTAEGEFDPRLSQVDFSFKVECPTEFDCKPRRTCPPQPPRQPDIDYLAKDYASFRQLMLDRISLLTPQWTERNAADLGITLVELLAYVGDYLSYQQDAVGTEAYLGTARRRTSIRRHARLVDYFMHDGSNARTWVQILVDANAAKTAADQLPVVPQGIPLSTQIGDQPAQFDDQQALAKADVVFETMHALDELFRAHNEIRFYTWGDRECCLPKGSTSAYLMDEESDRLRLAAGDVLIFEERLGPNTGLKADADPARRHAVRLRRVSPAAEVTQMTVGDEVRTKRSPGPVVKDPLNNQPYVEIEWDADDALPFPLCISARSDAEHGGEFVDDVSIALGNIVLADHGMSVTGEQLGTVPQPTLFRVPTASDDRCEPVEPVPVFRNFRPTLQENPLTHAERIDPTASATASLHQSMPKVVPIVRLKSQLGPDTTKWLPKRDLLNSAADANEFVVEVESGGAAAIRFGDDTYARRPEPGSSFTADYRVGNGTAGNIGAEALVHIVSSKSEIKRVRNPLPGRGGVDPESIEDVRQRAPHAYRTQQRAVTEKDYAEVTERHPMVQQAAATLRWTGSWHTAFVTVDRLGGLDVDHDFEAGMRRHIEPFRMAGHDLEIDGPRFVPLEIEMMICVDPGYFRGDVRQALLEKFSNRTLPDGTRGVFHPDNFTFGQTVYLSPLVRTAQQVAGVTSAQVTVFGRQAVPDPLPREEGRLKLGRLEIARLDNDRNFPERGVFRLKLGGGK